MCKNKVEQGKFVYFAAASVNLLTALAGIGYAWPSPFIPKLNGNIQPEKNPLSTPTTLLEDSWLASLQSLGAVTGPLLTANLSNWIGKKNTLILFSFSFIASSIITIFANVIWQFYAARFLVGVGSGCVFSLIPIYVAEISRVDQRGLASMIMAISMVGIQLLVYVIAPFITVSMFGVVCLIPSIIFLITFGIFVPESPYQLVLFNKMSQAEKALSVFRGKKDVSKDLEEIKKDIELTQEKVSLKTLLKSRIIRKSIIISLGMLLFQQLTGILPISSFLQTIFDSTNSPLSGEKSIMIIGGLQVIAVILTTFLINFVGRKKLLLSSYLGVFITLSILGTFLVIQTWEYDLEIISWLPMVTICLYLFSFSCGAGAISWTIIGEIFPSNVKSYLSSLAVLSLLLEGFVINLVFPTLSVYLGLGGLMWIFAGFTFCGMIFIWKAVPETKNKTFAEIQNLLENGGKSIT